MFLWVKASAPFLFGQGAGQHEARSVSCQDWTNFLNGAKRSFLDELIFPDTGGIIGQLCVAQMDVVKVRYHSGGPPSELLSLVASSK